MIPSNRWFPNSLQQRAAWFANFSTNFSLVGGMLGFTAAETTAAENDNTVFQFLAATTVQLDSFTKAVQQYRSIITEGAVGDPTPLFPPDVSFTLPQVIPTGIFQRLDENVKRIRTAPLYTHEIGALLGIIPSSSQPSSESEAEMHPTLSATSLPNSLVQVKFVRGATDGILIETSIDNGTWGEAGRFFKSPANLVIPENPQNLPRSVQMRARYVQGDNPFGQYSPIITTASQPST